MKRKLRLIAWTRFRKQLPRQGDHFICVDLSLLALKAAGMLDPDENGRLVAAGSSGGAFARRMNPQAPAIPVRTVRFSRDRALRVLDVEERDFDFLPVLADDIAVSGLTLERVTQSVRPRAEKAIVGMLFRSKTTRRRIDLPELCSVVTYSRAGGGNPPINTIGTLQQRPERLHELTERYFGDKAAQFAALVRKEAA